MYCITADKPINTKNRKEMANTSLGQLATFGLCIIGFVLCTLSCVGDSWIVGEVNKDGNQIPFNMGLWKVCETHSHITKCKTFSTKGLFNLTNHNPVATVPF